MAGPARHHEHGDLPVRARRGRRLGPGTPRLTHRAAWLDHDGPLPVIEGTLIRLTVDTCPVIVIPSRCGCGPRHRSHSAGWTGCGRHSCAVSTWSTPSGCSSRSSGWTIPKIRDPPAADRWTWLIIACHAQLRLARPLAADLRRPWERPAPPRRLTPARVRRGFRNIRAKTARPAGAPKPGKPGPGRPPGSKNRRPAPPPRRRQNDEEGAHAQGKARTHRLNGKLSGIPEVLLVTRRQPGAGPGRGGGQHLIG